MTRIVSLSLSLSLLGAAALLQACGSATLSPDDVRQALPAADAVQLGTPQARAAGKLAAKAGSPADAAAVEQAFAPAYHSEFAAVSYWTAVTVNVGVFWTLTLVERITRFPPTSCETDACTWGPWTSDDGLNAWQLRVEKQGDAYAYALSARPVAGGDLATLVAGHAFPGQDRFHGHGAFTIDFDAAATLAHPQGWTQDDFGRIDITYDNRVGTQVGALFLGARNKDPADPHFMSAAYAFDDTGAGGDFQVGLRNLDTNETLALHTRWNAAAAGRGDAAYTNGPTQWTASQCWDGAPGFALTYSGTVAPPIGSPDACVFGFAAPTIEIPAP